MVTKAYWPNEPSPELPMKIWRPTVSSTLMNMTVTTRSKTTSSRYTAKSAISSDRRRQE